jgi:hypothetical protein
MAEKKKERNGLKKLRKETGEKPTFYCENCKRRRQLYQYYCTYDRYSECTCIKGTKEEG